MSLLAQTRRGEAGCVRSCLKILLYVKSPKVCSTRSEEMIEFMTGLKGSTDCPFKKGKTTGIFSALMFSTFMAAILWSRPISSENHPAPNWIFNSKKAPVVLTSDSNKEVSVQNVSEKRVTSYDLGCVRLVKGNPQVLRTVESYRVDWGPGEGEWVMTTGQLESAGACRRLNALASVTRVGFSDGTRWQIERGPQENRGHP